jgi:hypothetical protein
MAVYSRFAHTLSTSERHDLRTRVWIVSRCSGVSDICVCEGKGDPNAGPRIGECVLLTVSHLSAV